MNVCMPGNCVCDAREWDGDTNCMGEVYCPACRRDHQPRACAEPASPAVRDPAGFSLPSGPLRTVASDKASADSDDMTSMVMDLVAGLELGLREKIAREIKAAKPSRVTRYHSPLDKAYDHAARIARGET